MEKLTSHPDYCTIPHQDKEYIKNTLRDIFPKTETLKQKLLEQYKHEYIKYKQEIEEQKQLEAERLRQEEKERYDHTYCRLTYLYWIF